MKTNAQPISSFGDKFSPKTIQPLNAANTDSKLIISVALVGSADFCATICKV
jgi:hypothetical protein